MCEYDISGYPTKNLTYAKFRRHAHNVRENFFQMNNNREF